MSVASQWMCTDPIIPAWPHLGVYITTSAYEHVFAHGLHMNVSILLLGCSAGVICDVAIFSWMTSCPILKTNAHTHTLTHIHTYAHGLLQSTRKHAHTSHHAQAQPGSTLPPRLLVLPRHTDTHAVMDVYAQVGCMHALLLCSLCCCCWCYCCFRCC